jgi:hypothetical protein
MAGLLAICMRLTTLSFSSLQALLAVASNASEPLTRRCGALEALEEVVEAIDNARDLEKLGGIHTLVALLADMEKDVRRGAAWVMGAAAQNNPSIGPGKGDLHRCLVLDLRD